MITATSPEWGMVKVDGLCNRGETLGDPWLIVVGSGYQSVCLIAITTNAQDAMDVYADSNHAYITKMDAPPPPEEEDWYCRLGNFGDWHDLSQTTRNSCVRCKVNYFAKKDTALSYS